MIFFVEFLLVSMIIVVIGYIIKSLSSIQEIDSFIELLKQKECQNERYKYTQIV